MNPTDIIEAVIFEDQSLRVRARVLGNDGAAVSQPTLSGITCTVYDRDASNEVTGTPVVSVETSVFNTYQSWSKDTTGYNFQFTIPAICFPLGNRRYRIEFKFTPSSGDPFHLVRLARTLDLVQS